VTAKPGARITVLYNQLGAHPAYTPPYHSDPQTPGVQYDAKDFIVLPLRDAQGVRYDRAATATYTLAATAHEATVYDKYGNPADPRIPTVGGDPVVIVEKTGAQGGAR